MVEKDRLRVLIQSPYPLSRNTPDGVKDFINGLVPHLEQKGCSIRLVAPDIREKDQNLATFTLGRSWAIHTGQTNFKAGFTLNKGLAHNILLTTKPDIVVMHEPTVPNSAHTLISAMPKREDGKPYPVLIGQFHARLDHLDRKSKAIMFAARHLARRFKLDQHKGLTLTAGYLNTIDGSLDGRIAVSDGTKRFCEQVYGGEYEVIYNGINTDELTPDGPKIEEWSDGKKTILFAGRHDPRKGIDDLIKAFNLIIKSGRNDIKLKITGKGEMTDSLLAMVDQLGISHLVEFLGIIPRSELVKAYRSADLVVAPSIDGEGFNRTIAEGRSCGTLVVCTNIPGQDEAIGEDLFRFMAQPRNPDDLARQISKVLDLPDEEKQRISKEGRRAVVARFSWPVIARHHVLYYEQLLSEHGKTLITDWPKKERRQKNWLLHPTERIPSMARIFDARRRKS